MAVTQSSPVLISLTAFGAAEVLRHGQLYFTELSHAAGADGVEVRGELLRDAQAELPALRECVRSLGMQVVYSSPHGLWRADGALDDAALSEALEHAALLGATRLKMSIGGFGAGSSVSFATLRERLSQHAVTLVIENDQTVSAGSIGALMRFFAGCDEARLPLGMTFDMGNWHYVGECSLAAADAFAGRVTYLHCKGVQRLPAKWVAVPLTESVAAWRSVMAPMAAGITWAIEYPLVGDDLLAVTAAQIALLRETSRQLNETRAWRN